MFLRQLSLASSPTPKAHADDFPAFAEKYLRIQDKQMRVVPLRLNHIQRRFMAERTGRDVVLKFRQGGFSTFEQARMFWKARTRAVSTMTLGKDEENKTRLRLMWQVFRDNLPEDMKPKPKYDNAGLIALPDTGSYQIMAIAGANGAGRSFSFTDVHLSEVAFFQSDPAKILTAVQNAGDPESILLESTPNGATGYFYDLCMELLKYPGRSPWTLHFYAWFDMPEYRLELAPGEVIEPDAAEAELIARHGLVPEQIKWRRHKLAEAMGRLDDFMQEYPEDPVTCFKLSGAGYFGDIDFAFIDPPETEPNPDDVYVGGLDWGQQNDYTSLRIRNRRTGNSVAGLRINRQSWAEMRRQVLDLCKQWKVKLLWAEENSASSNVENLREEADGITIVAVKMTHQLKVKLASNLRAAIHERTCRILDSPITRAEFRAAVSKETELKGWTMVSPRDGDGHGDDVIAEMLAHGAAQDYVEWNTEQEVLRV